MEFWELLHRGLLTVVPVMMLLIFLAPCYRVIPQLLLVQLPSRFIHWGDVNFNKRGLLTADRATTASFILATPLGSNVSSFKQEVKHNKTI
jgi:hypothetical protein